MWHEWTVNGLFSSGNTEFLAKPNPTPHRAPDHLLPANRIKFISGNYCLGKIHTFTMEDLVTVGAVSITVMVVQEHLIQSCLVYKAVWEDLLRAQYTKVFF